MVPTLNILVKEESGASVVIDWKYSCTKNVPLNYSVYASQPWNKAKVLQLPYDELLIVNLAKLTEERELTWKVNYPFYSPAVAS